MKEDGSPMISFAAALLRGINSGNFFRNFPYQQKNTSFLLTTLVFLTFLGSIITLLQKDIWMKIYSYPEHTYGGNGRHRYADVEAVRVQIK